MGSGIAAVHVWAVKTEAGVHESRSPGVRREATPFFLGSATLDQPRAALERGHSEAPSHAGFSLTASLAPGTYTLTAYVWSDRTNRWEDARTVQVVVR